MTDGDYDTLSIPGNNDGKILTLTVCEFFPIFFLKLADQNTSFRLRINEKINFLPKLFFRVFLQRFNIKKSNKSKIIIIAPAVIELQMIWLTRLYFYIIDITVYMWQTYLHILFMSITLPRTILMETWNGIFHNERVYVRSSIYMVWWTTFVLFHPGCQPHVLYYSKLALSIISTNEFVLNFLVFLRKASSVCLVHSHNKSLCSPGL